jgi:hypothetical protein
MVIRLPPEKPLSHMPGAERQIQPLPRRSFYPAIAVSSSTGVADHEETSQLQRDFSAGKGATIEVAAEKSSVQKRQTALDPFHA